MDNVRPVVRSRLSTFVMEEPGIMEVGTPSFLLDNSGNTTYETAELDLHMLRAVNVAVSLNTVPINQANVPDSPIDRPVSADSGVSHDSHESNGVSPVLSKKVTVRKNTPASFAQLPHHKSAYVARSSSPSRSNASSSKDPSNHIRPPMQRVVNGETLCGRRPAALLKTVGKVAVFTSRLAKQVPKLVKTRGERVSLVRANVLPVQLISHPGTLPVVESALQTGIRAKTSVQKKPSLNAIAYGAMFASGKTPAVSGMGTNSKVHQQAKDDVIHQQTTPLLSRNSMARELQDIKRMNDAQQETLLENVRTIADLRAGFQNLEAQNESLKVQNESMKLNWEREKQVVISNHLVEVRQLQLKMQQNQYDKRAKSAEEKLATMNKELKSVHFELDLRNTTIKDLKPKMALLNERNDDLKGKLEQRTKQISIITQQKRELQERCDRERVVGRSMNVKYNEMERSLMKIKSATKSPFNTNDLHFLQQITASPIHRTVGKVRRSMSESEIVQSTGDNSSLSKSGISHYRSASQRLKCNNRHLNGIQVQLFHDEQGFSTSFIVDDTLQENITEKVKVDKKSSSVTKNSTDTRFSMASTSTSAKTSTDLH